jgi:group I intron endonuclease
METNDTCLYIHTRKDDGGIFYVGIGNEKRPYSKVGRNKYWRRVINKHGFEVTIFKTDMFWKEACDLEIKMIAFYGRVNPSKKNPNYGCLVNMTDGGDGAKGAIRSKKTRKKMSKPKSQEHKKKIKESKTGEKHPMFGVIPSEESNQKRREKMTGEKNPFFDQTHTKESRQKISEKLSGEKNPHAKKVICIVTNKIYGCIKDAAKDNGVKHGTLGSWLNGRRPNKSSLRYI